MTFEEFKKKKREGSLINNSTSVSSSQNKMSFDEFKERKKNGTLLNNSKETNEDAEKKEQEKKINDTIAQLGGINSIASKRAQLNNATASKGILPTIGRTNKLMNNISLPTVSSTKSDTWNPEQSVAPRVVATPVSALSKLGVGALKAGEGFLDLGMTGGAAIVNTPRAIKIKLLASRLNSLEKKGAGDSESANRLRNEISAMQNDYDTYKDTMEDIIGKEWVEDYVGKSNEQFRKMTYLPKYAGNISESVGRMLPSVLSGQELAKQEAGKIATMLPFMGTAAGSSTEEALNEGASLENATKYGLLSGAVEGGIESLSGGIAGTAGNKIASKVLGKKVVGKLGKALLKAGDIATDVIGEGLEEVVSTQVNPYLKRATYNPNAELATNEDRWNSFRDGVVVSGILKGGQGVGTLIKNNQNNTTLSNNLEKGAVLGYTENRGDINGRKENDVGRIENEQQGTAEGNIERYIDEGRNGLYEESSKDERKFDKNEYQRWEQSIKPIIRENLSLNEVEAVDKAKNENNKDVYIFDENDNDNTYSAGASIDVPNRINVSRQQASIYGLENMIEHETVESDIIHNDIANDILTSVVETILSDNSFDIQKKKFWEGQEGAIPKDELIAKDILCDRFAEIKNRTKMQYENVLSNATKTNMDIALQNYYKQVYGKELNINTQSDTQSAFSMPENINPLNNLEEASKFVENATVNDIETLQNMIDIAEKNPNRIDLQFFAEKAIEKLDKLTRQQVREEIMQETGLAEYNLDDIKDVSKLRMNITTPVRVNERIFGVETAKQINDNFFKPIKHNEAERIRRLNKERAEINDLGIKAGSKESAAVQKYGEGEYIDDNGDLKKYTIDDLKREFPEEWQKLKNATDVLRSKYDTYLEEINAVLKENGYDPIPKRKDYFRHFEEINDLFEMVGIPTKVDNLPTDLNGMTDDLKPGKKFFANALQRKGKKTALDAIKGIDGYLEGAMDLVYHTRDIQGLRTLENYIRNKYGVEKGLENVESMSDEEKAKRIEQVNKGHLSEYAAWLKEYTNALAGKKSRLDRGIEEMFGRRAYKALNLIKKQVGSNMTGLNVNTALSNFISATQALPKTDKKAFVKGTVDTLKNIFQNDDFIDKSDFLTTRFGSEKLSKNLWEKASNVGQVFMAGTDYFTANQIVRSKYHEFIDKGLSEGEAIKKADEFADRLMAGRGKGDLPTAFESKILGILTQFQLEVNNQMDSLFYDTFKGNYAQDSKSKLAQKKPKLYNGISGVFVLGEIFALAYLFNRTKEWATGTEGGALDPIGTIADAFKYYSDKNLSKGEATAKVIEDISNQLPYASLITGGGRIPVSSAIPNVLSTLKGESSVGKEASKLFNLLPPTGGGQIRKSAEGLLTYAKGGSYSKDNEGNDKLKYPVEQNASNFVKSALFGKWSTPGAKEYIDSGFKSLSANQTKGYEKAIKAGLTSEEFYKAYNAQKEVKELGDLTSLVKKNKIDNAVNGLTSKQKEILYDTFNISKAARKSNRVVLPYEIKKKEQEIAREKLKKKKDEKK